MTMSRNEALGVTSVLEEELVPPSGGFSRSAMGERVALKTMPAMEGGPRGKTHSWRIKFLEKHFLAIFCAN